MINIKLKNGDNQSKIIEMTGFFIKKNINQSTELFN